MNSNDFQYKVEEIVNKYYKKDMPGLSLLIGKQGEVIYKNGFGFSNIENKEKCNFNTKYLIASISKQFTCMAIMMLKEKGLLDYNDTVKQYFPNYPEWYNSVTIRHLMTHTAGIPEYLTEEFLSKYSNDNEQKINITEVLDIIKGYEFPDFPAGWNWSYSNSGYIMLHHIIEKVSGEAFEDFVENNIFKPLNMESSLIPRDAKRVENSAIGYFKMEDGKFERAPYNLSVIGWADGNIMSTVEDLFKWSNALLTEKLVKKETLDEALKPYILKNGESTNYGFGHFLFNGRGVNEIWHSGSTEGYRSMLKRFTYENIVVIMLTNALALGYTKVDIMFDKIVDIVMKDKFIKFKPINLSEIELERYCCNFGSTTINGSIYKNNTKEGIVLDIKEDGRPSSREEFVFIGNNTFLSSESTGISCKFTFENETINKIIIDIFGRIIKINNSEINS